MAQHEVSFDATPEERGVIRKIAKRAVALAKANGVKIKQIDTEMDLVATHANGNPLRLDALLAADDFNVIHDVFGIRRHLDRETGKLTNCFRPRFSDCAARKRVAA
jgi:hypothetical protein